MTPGGQTPWAALASAALLMLLASMATADDVTVWRDDPARQLPTDQPALRITAVFADRFEAVATDAGLTLLQEGQWRFSRHADPRAANGYPDYAQIVAQLHAHAAAHPDYCRTEVIGTTDLGTELVAIRITDNPDDLEPEEPRVKIVASMHGDEKIAAFITLELIDYLLSNRQSNQIIGSLLEQVDLQLLPVMNPEGWQHHARENLNDPNGDGNPSPGVDLNRNFPSPFAGASQAVPEHETQAVMDWTLARQFLLSAGLHSGATGIVYPWGHPHDYLDPATQFPETALARKLAFDYTQGNPYLYNFTDLDLNPGWDRGTINGADWYAIHNEMADWNYRFAGCLETTIEFSNSKSPYPSTAFQYFLANDGSRNNRDALVEYVTASLNAVTGQLVDGDVDAPIAGKIAVRHPIGDDYDAWLLLPPLRPGWQAVGLPRQPLDPDFSFGPDVTSWRYDCDRGILRRATSYSAGAAYFLYVDELIPAQLVAVSRDLPAWTPKPQWQLASLPADASLTDHHALDLSSRRFRRIAADTTIPAGRALWLRSPDPTAPPPTLDPWPLPDNLPYPNLSAAAGGTTVAVTTHPIATGSFQRLLAPGSTPLWCTAAEPPAINHSPPASPVDDAWQLTATFQPPLKPAAVLISDGKPVWHRGLPLPRTVQLPLQATPVSLKVVWQHATDGASDTLAVSDRSANFMLPIAAPGDSLQYHLELRDQQDHLLVRHPTTGFFTLATP